MLEFAAIFVNGYRNSVHFTNDKRGNDTLRKYVAERFGAVYAAILVQ